MFKRRRLQVPTRKGQACKIDTAEPFSRIFYAAECEKCIENQESKGRSPSGKMARLPCKDYLKGTCTIPFCEKWHPLECLFNKSENGCKFGDKCSYAHRQVDELPSKKSKNNGDRIAVAILKNTRQMGCVSQDMEPPKSSSILRKSSTTSKPVHRVRFTKTVLHFANIRDTKLSLGVICPGDPHQRNPQCHQI